MPAAAHFTHLVRASRRVGIFTLQKASTEDLHSHAQYTYRATSELA